MSTNMRPSFHETYFKIAEDMARQATCIKKYVGCVLVNQHGVLVSTGYNGAPYGVDTCIDVGCLDEGGHCVRAVHAEIRAITNAARSGIILDGGVAFCTLLPCIQCMQALYLCGVGHIWYDEVYHREEKASLFVLASQAGIQLKERSRE